jgi:hypothetical protein
MAWNSQWVKGLHGSHSEFNTSLDHIVSSVQPVWNSEFKGSMPPYWDQTQNDVNSEFKAILGWKVSLSQTCTMVIFKSNLGYTMIQGRAGVRNEFKAGLCPIVSSRLSWVLATQCIDLPSRLHNYFKTCLDLIKFCLGKALCFISVLQKPTTESMTVSELHLLAGRWLLTFKFPSHLSETNFDKVELQYNIWWFPERTKSLTGIWV